jgi:hypothetical protein
MYFEYSNFSISKQCITTLGSIFYEIAEIMILIWKEDADNEGRC